MLYLVLLLHFFTENCETQSANWEVSKLVINNYFFKLFSEPVEIFVALKSSSVHVHVCGTYIKDI